MWTRNYKNLICTMTTLLAEGNSSGSAANFGDNYHFNFKNPSGQLREICNYATSSNYAYYCTTGRLVYRAANSTRYQSGIEVITDQTKTKLPPDKCNISIGFGSSDNDATELDYALGSQISALTSLSAIATPTLNDDGTFTIDYQVVIQTTEDITIREIGLYKVCQYYNSSSSVSEYALINRIVLDSPISVASGEVATVAFSVTTPKIAFN